MTEADCIAALSAWSAASGTTQWGKIIVWFSKKRKEIELKNSQKMYIYHKFISFNANYTWQKGPYTNYVNKQGGGGFAKCLCYYISLCCKLVYGGGRGVKNLQSLVYVVCVWPQTVLRKSQKSLSCRHPEFNLYQWTIFRIFEKATFLGDL